MPHIVFIAPHFLENTNRYVRAFSKLDVTLSVVSADPEVLIPEDIKPKVAGHYQIPNPLDAGQLTTAVRALSKGVGKVDRIAGVLEQLQLPLAEVRDALDIEGIRQDVARNFRDKDRMKAVLRKAGVPVAKSALATSMNELRAFIEQVGFPIIVKPQAGVGARATYRVTSTEELAALAKNNIVPSTNHPLQIEEFVRARENTCETVTVRGKPVWRSGTYYLPSPLETLETPWIKYCVLLPREDDEDHRRFHPINGAALAALFGPAAETSAGSALSHMEWFQRDDGTALVNEVGVRPPGVQIMPLMCLANEADLFSDWARLVSLDQFEPLTRKWAAGAAFIRGQGAGDRIVSVTGVDEAVAAAGDALVEFRTPKVGQPRAAGYEGESWALVRHATTDGARKALRALIELVQVRYG